MARAPSRFFGVRLPIVLSPMAGVGTPALAAAVSEAGGLGSIAVGAMTPPKAREAIRKTRELTSKPFAVNVFCHAPPRRDPSAERAWIAYLRPLFEELGAEPPSSLSSPYVSFVEPPTSGPSSMLQVLLDEKPAFVSFHFGLPLPDQLQALKRAGIRTLATATSPAEASLIEAAGVDAIVAQGIEAGGHRGQFDRPQAGAGLRDDGGAGLEPLGDSDGADVLDAPGYGAVGASSDLPLSTLQLVRELSECTSLPIVAAGGISDGRDAALALEAGASAVQLGTAFAACDESAADGVYRALLRGSRSPTRLTTAISGRAARGFPTKLVAWAERPHAPPPPAYPIAYDAAKKLAAAAAAAGKADDYAVRWAGTGVGRARGGKAGDLVRELERELVAAGWTRAEQAA